MAYTMQQVVDRARIPLLDPDKDRYPDSQLLSFAVDGLTLAVAKRPDLLLGTSWAPSFGSLALGSAFPLSDRYVPILADYVSGRAELVNDESATSDRFTTLVGNYEAKLVTP